MALATASALCAQAPITKVEPVTEVLHGVSITDNYRWLEDQNSPATRAWIAAQQKYTDTLLATVPESAAIRKRLGELLRVNSVGAPFERQGRYFLSKRSATQTQAVLYTRLGLNGADEVLLDPITLSSEGAISVSFAEVTDDGNLIAYYLRQGGTDETTMHLMETRSKKKLTDRFPPARYSTVSFKPDGSGFYYSVLTPAGPRFYYHALGTDGDKDPVIFGAQFGQGLIGGCELSQDGRWLVFTIYHGSSGTKTEVWFKDLKAGTAPKPLVNDVTARFEPAVAGDRVYMLTNWNAPQARILMADLNKPERSNWKEVLAEGKTPVDRMSLIGGRIVISRLQNAVGRVEILDPNGKLIRAVRPPTFGTVTHPSGRWQSAEAFYGFSTFGQPQSLYRYDVATGAQSMWWKPEIPVDPANFVVKQVWYVSKDKTRVPMFIAHKKGLKLDGSHRAILTGYGGFTLVQQPVYSSFSTIWLEHGGVYALPNLRGGGEFGEAWHKAGMLGNKQNVYDDFIAAGEYLIKSGYTQKSKLAIYGGSNGGLLVGAAVTQRPDLFAAVLCNTPLLDMLRYQLFKVARLWVPEYGSSEDPSQFKFLHAYSPYHNVKKGTQYPSIMFDTGDSDTRVDPLHARKMTALMQASTGSTKPVVLLYDTAAGHSTGLSVDKAIEQNTARLAFLVSQTK